MSLVQIQLPRPVTYFHARWRRVCINYANCPEVQWLQNLLMG